ncbi:MAG: nucleotidyltransferase family protein [Anaerolineae bacterium]
MTQAAEKRRNPALEEVRRILQAQLPELHRQYGVTSLAIFGSYVHGEQTRDSDLDLLVEFDDHPLTLLQFIALENELTDRLGVKVDLVERNTLKPAIGRHVLQEAEML